MIYSTYTLPTYILTTAKYIIFTIVNMNMLYLYYTFTDNYKKLISLYTVAKLGKLKIYPVCDGKQVTKQYSFPFSMRLNIFNSLTHTHSQIHIDPSIRCLGFCVFLVYFDNYFGNDECV